MAQGMRSILLALVPFTTMGVACAQEISFTAKVDRQTIAAGEHVRLTVTLVNAKEAFTAPDLGGLVIVQGPYEQSSFNYVNGRMSSTVSRTWTLTGTREGRFTIGPATVRIGGGIIQTESITIEVGKAVARPQDPQAAQGQGRDPNLFATIALSRNKGYVGEQIIATWTLYSRYNNLELSRYDVPKMNGFWAEDVDLGTTSWQDKLETINGLQYRVAILKKQVLLPQRSGKLRIEPLELTCIVNRSFFNRGQQLELKSNAVEFTAQELPTPAPTGFQGAVGELQLNVRVDRSDVKANEAVELSLKLSGRSNLKLLETPRLDLPADFDSYDPKVTDKITVNANGMSGSREFQYLLIPRYEGIYDLGAITYSYFDTKAGAYRTLRADPITIQVDAGDATQAAPQRPGKSDVRVLDRDIRYIRTGDLGLRPKGWLLHGSAPWLAGMATPPLAFLLFLLIRHRRQRDLADPTGRRRRLADRVARDRLKQAQDALRNADRATFHTALSKALTGYMADKAGVSPAEVTPDRVRTTLAAQPDGAALAQEFLDLSAVCDMARFAPVEEHPRQELYDRAARLIGRLEQTLRT